MLLLGRLQNYYDVLDMFHIQHAGLTGWGQIVGEGVDRTGCLVLEEDGVICGCIMVWEWLQNNTEDSISPSLKAWTFDPFLSLTHSSSLLSRLVLHICFKILFGVVRGSGMRRAISFFSCQICNRRRLRAAAAGDLLFLFCTADRLTTEVYSSHGLHTGVEGAATIGVGAGNSFPQSRSKGELVTKLCLVSTFSSSTSSNFCLSSSTHERYSSLFFSLVIAHGGGGTSHPSPPQTRIAFPNTWTHRQSQTSSCSQPRSVRTGWASTAWAHSLLRRY